MRELTAGRAELIARATAQNEREGFSLAEEAVRLGCKGVLEVVK